MSKEWTSVVATGSVILRVYDSYTDSPAQLCLENPSDSLSPLGRAFHWQKRRTRAWEEEGKMGERRESEEGGERKTDREGRRGTEGSGAGRIIEPSRLTCTPGQSLTEFSTKVPLPSEDSDKNPQKSSLYQVGKLTFHLIFKVNVNCIFYSLCSGFTTEQDPSGPSQNKTPPLPHKICTKPNLVPFAHMQ